MPTRAIRRIVASATLEGLASAQFRRNCRLNRILCGIQFDVIGTKRPASRDRFEGAVRQTHHMQGIERPLRQITNLAAHEVRTNLLFTMSNRTGGEHDARRKLLLRMTFSHQLYSTPLYPMGTKEWWSRTGSNRRHPACKAGALPAELRPLIVFPDMMIEEMVGLGGLEPPTSRLSSARSNQLSYKPLDCAADRLSPTRRTSRKADRPSRLVPRPRGAPGRRPVRRASASQSHSLKKEKRRRQTRLRYARR